MTKHIDESPARPCDGGIPLDIHRWNLWISGSEAAIYIAGANLIGPMTLIPFLFKQIGIDNSWLGLFTIAGILPALGCPLGTALAGGRQWKLPFCIQFGVLQRAPFLLVPLGVMFLFSSPAPLLVLLVVAWMLSNFLGGVCWPVYNAMLTTGIRERWWGRMMSIRSFLAAAAGLAATTFVWWVNRHVPVPHNYTVLGWAAVLMLSLSLYVCSRFREIPLRADQSRGVETLRSTFHTLLAILREDKRVLWLVFTHVIRSCGFLLGTYMTAVLVERCALNETQMWIPVIMIALPDMASQIVSGWMIDRYGSKTALVLSALLVAANSIAIMFCHTLAQFAVLFASAMLGGSLFTNAWPTFIVKLAPATRRPAYISTISLASAPGAIATSLLGVYLVHGGGYAQAFYVSATGGILGAILYMLKVPDIRHAPAE